ncbi:MAG: GNAT family N-acetyltransferase [Novosphingobium sp.]|uniref:GNAT family N-acetyltransferase n=1 Tax=Novosphingobium sp. TaxID=1874826 RepID=UPI001E0382B6|nr:GNAT family N-acetyltransferase [Novosphingobium sp.]MCB2056864.1 GNAT family N-acetyltransferase [Novosphingobium sp.]MCP5387386.1 GNAT family N-acetyltransferase [Novosphingobium sp.]
MASDLEVAPISGMDDDIAVLIEEAGSAGFPFMETLRREWVSGENRFDAPGECYLAIYRHGEMVAAGGLNRDPYADDPAIGRIRHVYVRKAARRTGAGRHLLERLVAHAGTTFTRLRLRTRTAEGAAFYETIGFERCGDETATHVLDLQAAALSAAPPLSTKRLPQ